MKILKKDTLKEGGFAGIREHRLIVDKSIGGRSDTFDGLGNLVYLADAYFEPFGQTNMHSHKNIDVISVFLEGDVDHEGSLNHKVTLKQNQVQVQKSGKVGFIHNEINPNEKKSHIIQIWVIPQDVKDESTYELYDLKQGNITTIYGSDDINTHLEVASLNKNQKISKDGKFQLYITKGKAKINGVIIDQFTLIEDTSLELEALSDITQVIIISKK